jgi:hypothetical protein
MSGIDLAADQETSKNYRERFVEAERAKIALPEKIRNIIAQEQDHE